MTVNIYTDASVNSEHKVGGYAFVIMCDAGKIIKAAKFKGAVSKADEAEMMCIANAIHTLKESKFSNVTKIVVNTDSQCAINFLYTNDGKPNTKEKRHLIDDIYFTMLETCLKFGFSIRDVNKVFEFVKVKAHTDGSDLESRANRYCDLQARSYCRKAVSDITKKIKK